ncbi:MAG: EscU/YscU/HrcU family type III secretion system export apparatus switch protein [Tissierellales bacterium]|jgi:flagellar biosynthesis protein|nr:EscU/YscU/HrcU family type III secretion system export apparatus switch protein [Tissierellales bacterium]
MIYKKFNFKKKKEVQGESAVAIKYGDTDSGLPEVKAHGKGMLAEKIIELAKKNNIPMQEDPSLVANLIDLDLGDSVPPQLYSVIAEILILIEELEGELY